MKELTLEEVESRIEWLVRNMPPFPPPWATDTLRKLINEQERLKGKAQ